MSDERKKTRSVSEETQIRKLLQDLTDRILKMDAEMKTNMTLIKGRFDDIDAELAKGRSSHARQERGLKAAVMLAGDALKKVNDLHAKQIGSTDQLGKRIHELEQQRGKSASGGVTTRRPTR